MQDFKRFYPRLLCENESRWGTQNVVCKEFCSLFKFNFICYTTKVQLKNFFNYLITYSKHT